MVTRERTGTVSVESYERVALRDPEGQWELLDGTLREKPGMSGLHNHLMMEIAFALANQAERSAFHLRTNSGRLRKGDTFFVPDVMMIGTGAERLLRGHPDRLEAYETPVALVIEIFCLAAAGYDIGTKLALYRERDDAEIWYIHPYDRTITVWRRRPDGGYDETNPPFGPVEVASLPGVTIDLAALLDDA